MDTERVRRKYRRNALAYDLVARPLARLRARAVERLQLRAGDAVLDFGCGTGLGFELVEADIGPAGRFGTAYVAVGVKRPREGPGT